MLQLRSDLLATVDQLPTVNCQLIIRSELLELPYLDLITRLREEADQNPALELEVSPPEDIPWVWPRFGRSAAFHADDSALDPLTRVPAEYTLRDELRRRASWVTSGLQRDIAAYLIENIDERGYLSITILDAAYELEVEPTEVEMALRTLQQVAPPGVGARDLRECLLLQLEAMDDVPDWVRVVVERCYEIMDGESPHELCQRLGLTRRQIIEALEVIRNRLTPYPGESFRPHWHRLLPDNREAVQPDVILRREGEQIEVELVTSATVVLKVAEAYERLDRHMRALKARAEDEATTRARAQVRAARQMIWSLQQRERSLYHIARAIVDHQREFILHGPLYHRPLTHKRIAEITGLHESTISRAMMDKLVMLPSGESVPFTVFFDDALPAKTILRSLVAGEEREAPLTDEQLQEMMRDEGFELARRTVNKYRRALGIPSSSERRRMYFFAHHAVGTNVAVL